MRKLVLLSLFLSLCGYSAAAQDYPKAEIFGGFQYTHLEPNFNAPGWNASAAINLNNWFGAAADFSGAYDQGVKQHTYLFGPVLSARGRYDKITPFAHALFGGAHLSGGGASTNGFGMAFGGGVDAKLTPNAAVRLMQVDWAPERFSGVWVKKNVRVSFGLVYRF